MYKFLILLGLVGLIGMASLYYLKEKERHLQDPQYNIVALMQSCPQQEPLKTEYLAELLQLSMDIPHNLHAFDLHQAEQRLLLSPVIKEVAIKKILPGSLYIQYQMRSPLAYLGEMTNTLIDAEGYLFPASPFFTPKRLPRLYLGLNSAQLQWGHCVAIEKKFQLAVEILIELKKSRELESIVTHVDVSQTDAESCAKQEVVLELCTSHSRTGPSTFVSLHLNPCRYHQGLKAWQVLHSLHPHKDFKMVDMRLFPLAFITMQQSEKHHE